MGRSAGRRGGAALYAPGAPFSFTYPPFAAWLFSAGAHAPVAATKIAMTAGSVVALAVLCGQALAAAGVRRRPETVFAVWALALQTWPVAYTFHLGEVNLVLAALIGADLLRPREDEAWWQGIGTGLAAGIKLTPLIFVAYLALTGRRTGGGARGRDLRGHRRGGIRLAARAVPDILAGRGVLMTRTGSAIRPTRRTSPCPGRWPGWPAPGTHRASGGWSRC